jgi:hypothetical protein
MHMHQHPSHTLYLTLITLSACCTYPTRCIHHIQSVHHPRSVIIFIMDSSQPCSSRTPNTTSLQETREANAHPLPLEVQIHEGETAPYHSDYFIGPDPTQNDAAVGGNTTSATHIGEQQQRQDQASHSQTPFQQPHFPHSSSNMHPSQHHSPSPHPLRPHTPMVSIAPTPAPNLPSSTAALHAALHPPVAGAASMAPFRPPHISAAPMPAQEVHPQFNPAPVAAPVQMSEDSFRLLQNAQAFYGQRGLEYTHQRLYQIVVAAKLSLENFHTNHKNQLTMIQSSQRSISRVSLGYRQSYNELMKKLSEACNTLQISRSVLWVAFKDCDEATNNINAHMRELSLILAAGQNLGWHISNESPMPDKHHRPR